MNVICLYWVGNFMNKDFCLNDVHRLYKSVKKHIDRAFDFYVLTNDETEVTQYYNTIPLRHNWPGWWSKMELGREDLPVGRTLYMDLDSCAVNNLQPILDFPGDLVMFNTPIPKHKHRGLKKEGWVCRYQNATMLFTARSSVMINLYNQFKGRAEKLMDKYRSDQDVIGAWLPFQPTFPNEWMTKLSLCQNAENKLNETCIIVTGRIKKGNDNYVFRNTVDWIEGLAR